MLKGRHTLRILRGSSANDALKIFDDVRLIGIAKLEYHRLPIYHSSSGQAFSHFMESIAFDHPLRTDADILTEEPLQRPFVEIEAAHDVINLPLGLAIVDFSLLSATSADLVPGRCGPMLYL
jgi:hypothetical protein